MADLSSLERLRPCGRLETYSTARHEIDFYKNVSCAATYNTSTSGIPLRSLVYQALNAVIARHSMLSAIPLNEDKNHPNAYFARLSSVDLRTCVEFVEREKSYDKDDELDAVLQQQHNRNFKGSIGTTPCWRLVVVHDPRLLTNFSAVWVFHHALADGTSALVFHRTFLEALKDISTGESGIVNSVVNPPIAQLLPPLEDMHSLSISPLFLFKALLGSILPSWFNPRPAKLWTGGPVSMNTVGSQASLRSLVVPAASTQKLLELSRQNKITMTATLQCIIASAILENLDTEQYERVTTSGPISLRRFMKWDEGNIDDEFVNGMTQYEHVHVRTALPSPASSFSWNEARAVRAAIQDELNEKGQNSVTGLLRYVSDMHKMFIEKVGQEREHSFEISNLGLYNAKKDGSLKTRKEEARGWKIGRCVFSQSPGVVGAAIAVSVVTGGDGCAALAFTWFQEIVESEMVENVIKSVKKDIETLVG